MEETITVYNRVSINRHTGEVTKYDPVELTIDQFMGWMEPAIPYLAKMVIEARKYKIESEDK